MRGEADSQPPLLLVFSLGPKLLNEWCCRGGGRGGRGMFSACCQYSALNDFWSLLHPCPPPLPPTPTFPSPLPLLLPYPGVLLSHSLPQAVSHLLPFRNATVALFNVSLGAAAAAGGDKDGPLATASSAAAAAAGHSRDRPLLQLDGDEESAWAGLGQYPGSTCAVPGQ